MKTSLLATCVLLACVGCTTQALDRRTLELGETTTDLHYREVLENLAMIANNRWALPSFSSYYAGTSDLSDTASIQVPLVPYRSSTLKPLFLETLDGSVSRAVKDNWTLDPVVVPEKLLALRCACWCVLDHCVYTDCGHSVFLGTYSYDPGLHSPPGYYFEVEGYLQRSVQTNWLQLGKCKNAVYAAKCRGTEVYVTSVDMNGLSELTIAMEHIARADFSTVYYPKPVTRSIKITQKQQGDQQHLHLADKLAINSITLTVDERGWVTPGSGKYSSANPNQPKGARGQRWDRR